MSDKLSDDQLAFHIARYQIKVELGPANQVFLRKLDKLLKENNKRKKKLSDEPSGLIELDRLDLKAEKKKDPTLKLKTQIIKRKTYTESPQKLERISTDLLPNPDFYRRGGTLSRSKFFKYCQMI